MVHGSFSPDRSYRDTIKTKKAFNGLIEFMSKEHGKHELNIF